MVVPYIHNEGRTTYVFIYNDITFFFKIDTFILKGGQTDARVFERKTERENSLVLYS